MKNTEREYPDIIQMEVTNNCNFNCIMCIRHFWKARLGDMSYSLFEKVATEAFPHAKRVVMYGEGEPLVHPQFFDLAKLTRELLPQEGTIFFSTNGSLLTPRVGDKLVKKIGVDEIAVSVDSSDFVKLKKIRVGAKPSEIFEHIKHLGKIKKDAKRDFKLGVETVIMKANLTDLPYLIEQVAEMNVDYISVSHLVPYTEALAKQAVYVLVTQEAYDIIKDAIDYGWDLIRLSAYEKLALSYGYEERTKASEILKTLWNKAKEREVEINIPLVLKEKEKLGNMHFVEKVFDEARRVAQEMGIEVILPDILPKETERTCPYIEKNAAMIRSDGEVVPCFNFSYTHTSFVNGHTKQEEYVSFGNVKERTLKEIWNSKEYKEFRDLRRDMHNNIPWCGNCPFSTMDCWFVRSNEMDCYGQKPSCSECLYSVNITRCLL
ncbi:MAG: SPASM domain-containing protein [Candidatus Odinarchaeota archaeon]|nr:SPASM domain-containing protein [Candidatus Odinarchaeota archaeon]